MSKELFVFSRDDDFLSVLTNNTGLVDTWFKDYENEIMDNAFVFTINNQVRISTDGVLPMDFIKEENQVAFYDRDNELRLMRIKEIEELTDLDGSFISVICEPSYLELYDNLVEERRPQDRTAKYVLDIALEDTRYEGQVGVDLGKQSTSIYWINSIEIIWDILSIWGGALKDVIELDDNNNITKRLIKIVNRRGGDKGLLVESDRNAESVERISLSYIYTAMWGQGDSLDMEDEDGEATGGHSRYITFEDIEWKKSEGDPTDKPKGQKWVGDESARLSHGYLGADGVRRHRYGHFSNQDYDDENDLLYATWMSLQEQKAGEVIYKAKIVESEKDVSLGDTATILNRDFDKPIEVQSQITGLEYDILDDKIVDITLGKYIDMSEDPLQQEIDDIKKEQKRPTVVGNDNFPDIKPKAPTNFTVIGGFQTIILSWDWVDELYINKYEVYGSKNSDFVPSSQFLLYSGDVSGFGHEVKTDEKWYYYVRAVNTHGTVSEFTEKFSATTVRIINDDILFGKEIAQDLRDLDKISGIIGEGTIDIGKLHPDLPDRFKQEAKEYTDEEIKETRDGLLEDIAEKVDADYVDGELVGKVDLDEYKRQRQEIIDDLLDKVNKEYVDGALVDKVDKVDYEDKVNEIVADLGDKVDAEYVDGELEIKVDQDKYDKEISDIIKDVSDKVEIDYVDGELKSKVNKEDYDLEKQEILDDLLDKVDAEFVDGKLTDKVDKEEYELKVKDILDDIADKVDIEYVDGVLVDKVDRDDYDEKVTKIEKSITDNESEITSKIGRTEYDTDIDGVVSDLTNHDSRISQTEKDISSKVDETIYNKDKESSDLIIENNTSEINQNAKEIKSKVESSLFDEVEGRVEEAESSITQNADSIKSKVEQSDYDKKTSDLSSDISEVEQTAEKISSKVTNVRTDLDNLEVGGRNLYKNTGEQYDWDITEVGQSERKPNKMTVASEEALDVINVSGKITTSFLVKTKDLKYVKGSKWLGFETKIVFEDGSHSFIRLSGQSIKEGTQDWTSYTNSIDFRKSIKENGKIVSFRSSSTILARAVTGIISIKNFKVEVGDIATNWTPAPEDVEGRITENQSSIIQNADSIESKVEQTEFDEVEGRLNIAESSIVQTEKDITSKVEQKDFDLVDDRVEKAESSIIQNATSIESKVEQEKFDEAEDRIVEAESSIKQNADSIISKVEQVDFDEIESEVGSNKSSISQNAKDITSKVESSEFNAVEGRVSDSESSIKQNADSIKSKVEESDFNKVDGRLEEAESSITQNSDSIKSKVEQSVVDEIDGRVDTAESSIEQNADSIKSKVEQTEFDSVEGRIDEAESSITQNANSIKSKVEQSVVDEIDGRVDEAESSITQNADSIKSKVEQSVVDEIDGRVEEAESSITQNADSIISKVEKTEFDEVEGRINDAESSIIQNADSITSKVEQTEFELVEGRLDKSESEIVQNAKTIQSRVTQEDFDVAEGRIGSAESKITQNADSIESKVSSSDYKIDQDGVMSQFEEQGSFIIQNAVGLVSKVEQKTYDKFTDSARDQFSQIDQSFDEIRSTVSDIVIGTDNLFENSVSRDEPNSIARSPDSDVSIISTKESLFEKGDYVAQARLFGDEKSDVSLSVFVKYLDIDGEIISLEETPLADVADNNYGNVIIKFTLPEEATRIYYTVRYTGSDFIAVIYHSEEKLEKGHSETEWKPSLEQFEGRMVQAESNITQNADKISLKVDVDGIVSAINLDEEGVRIEGDLIHLDGLTLIEEGIIKTAHIDDLAVTRAKLEDAIIGSAQIDDLAVQYANIGKAVIDTSHIRDGSITNAEIKNLDVDKIEGRVSSFVQTNWNNICNSVQMNAGGMETYSGSSRTSLLNGSGHAFFRDGRNIGTIGTSSWVGYSGYRGLSFQLDTDADYMVWSHRNKVSDESFTARLTWHKSSTNIASKGFHFDDNVQINDVVRMHQYLYVGDGDSGLIGYNDDAIDLSANSRNKIEIFDDGHVQFKAGGITRHTFYADGSKKGGSIELNDGVYGLSPVDSPQTLIEYIEFDVELTGEGIKVVLDDKFIQSTDNYAVFQNNGTVVKKLDKYFIIKGEGMADIRIVGYRRGATGLSWTSMDDVEGYNPAHSVQGAKTELIKETNGEIIPQIPEKTGKMINRIKQ